MKCASCQRQTALVEAERQLRKVPTDQITWRSRLILYHVVSRLRQYDFKQRLEILRELEADRDFQWPMQLRLEYGILLYQLGDPTYRQHGDTVFRRLRDELKGVFARICGLIR